MAPQPLYAEIVHRAHKLGFAGDSAFRGIEGHGASSHIHASRLLSLADELPLAIVIVDEPAPVTALQVFLVGAAGAPARYLIDRHIRQRYETVFPYGTLAVNVAGSLLLGLRLGLSMSIGVPEEAVALLGFGFCGALTTFSTVGFETVRLLEDGSVIDAGVNAVGSLLLGALAAFAG